MTCHCVQLVNTVWRQSLAENLKSTVSNIITHSFFEVTVMFSWLNNGLHNRCYRDDDTRIKHKCVAAATINSFRVKVNLKFDLRVKPVLWILYYIDIVFTDQIPWLSDLCTDQQLSRRGQRGSSGIKVTVISSCVYVLCLLSVPIIVFLFVTLSTFNCNSSTN